LSNFNLSIVQLYRYGVISENGKNLTLRFFRDFLILMQQVQCKSQRVSYA